MKGFGLLGIFLFFNSKFILFNFNFFYCKYYLYVLYFFSFFFIFIVEILVNDIKILFRIKNKSIMLFGIVFKENYF